MKDNKIEKIASSVPVDKTAALVTSSGVDYVPNKEILTNDQSTPIRTRPVKTGENLTGKRRGRLTVVGLARDIKGSWVVRCDCGTYTTRKAKAIKNENNDQDRCEECRQLAFLKREEHYRRSGKDKDIKEY